MILKKIKNLRYLYGEENRGSDNDNNKNNSENGSSKGPSSFVVFLFITIVGLLFISTMLRMTSSSSTEEISYNKFIEMVSQNSIEEVRIDSDRLIITEKVKEDPDGNAINLFMKRKTYYTGIVEDYETITNRMLDAGIVISGKVEDGSSFIISIIPSIF